MRRRLPVVGRGLPARLAVRTSGGSGLAEAEAGDEAQALADEFEQAPIGGVRPDGEQLRHGGQREHACAPSSEMARAGRRSPSVRRNSGSCKAARPGCSKMQRGGMASWGECARQALRARERRVLPRPQGALTISRQGWRRRACMAEDRGATESTGEAGAPGVLSQAEIDSLLGDGATRRGRMGRAESGGSSIRGSYRSSGCRC